MNYYLYIESGAIAKVAPQQFVDPAADLLVKYREILEAKKDLKRKLKKFDEDFMMQHNRAPKKSDKEVIRPMYQNYHEVSIFWIALVVV